MTGAAIGTRVSSPPRDAQVFAALEPFGLQPRGWLVPDEASAPRLGNGMAAKAICLVGHGGGGFWPVFQAWRSMHPGIADPLDAWSKAVIEPVAALLGGEAVFPSDRPWHPFQQWAMQAEALKPSPLGLLIHPDYGLWHGYRGAILFAEAPNDGVSALPGTSAVGPGVARPRPEAVHPCDMCWEKPCLSACPVGAFSPDGFAVEDCRTFVTTEAGTTRCMASGCRARDACPVGRPYRYGADQIRFHMAAFV
ncbi:MAG: ferredoxin [Hoeflea sp.]|uniref:ferredoxin n=1 Tax=Hoeflea sp. TaxID=1940281 RepID=UPI000C0DA7D2|nr:ferredoxin [Hoeflea sp.]PHR19966.1 MAG: ferredoxin [Hoeflea sp.]